MAQQSEIDICNLALQWLGEKRILSLAATPEPEDQKTATVRELCKLNYPIARDATLEDADWTFATRYHNLAMLDNPPNDPRPPLTGNVFQLPGEVLRVIDIDDGSGNWSDYRQWNKVEDRIVAEINTCYACCVIRVEDTARFSSAFVMAHAARLGAEIAIAITESNAREDRMWARYARALDTARANDGMQGAAERFRSNTARMARIHGNVEQFVTTQ